MNALTDWLLASSAATTITLALVLLVRRLAGARLDARAIYALWLAVPVQLLLLIPGLAPDLPEPVRTVLPTLNISGSAPAALDPARAAGLPVLVWLIGLGLMLHRLGLHLLDARSLWLHARPLTDQPALPSLPGATLHQSSRVDTPLVTGLLRPRIVVPPGFPGAHSQATAALILGHELCHLRRRDNLVNLAAELLRAVQWFNPLAWIAMRAFRTDQEVSADAAALAQSRAPAAGRYGRALLDLAGHSSSPALTSAWISARSLKRRIVMLDHHRPARARALATGLVLALSLPLAGTALGAGGERPSPDAEPAAAQDVVPLVRINPRYPVDAAEQRIEGFVTAEFTITEDGRVTDIVVLDSAPGDTFVPEATIALSRWRFKPMTVDGVAVPRRATQTIEFALD